jgi:hypothetical protein
MTIKRINRGRGHSYTIDGQKAVGVTTAISEGWPQPWMGPWSAKTVAQTAVDMDPEDMAALRRQGRDAAIAVLKGAPNRQRDTAAARGTEVHKIAEQVIDGTEVAVPEHLAGHVESVVRFLDEWQVTSLLQEVVVGSYRHLYAGTFDLIGELPDGTRILFDYKTSSSIKETTAMQLAAYRWADFYIAGPDLELPIREIGIDDTMAVHIRADGYDVYPLDTSQDVFNAFLHTLAVARSHKVSEDWVKAPVSAPKAVAA